MTSTTKSRAAEREIKRRERQRHQKPPAYTALTDSPALPVDELEQTTSTGALNTQLYARPPPWPSVDQRCVFTIPQFCEAHDISYGHFYKMQRDGTGPRTMKMGTRRVISVEEAARWRAERTAAAE
jgi:predicted DNA-binding transcriptional regulator AlpA